MRAAASGRHLWRRGLIARGGIGPVDPCGRRPSRGSPGLAYRTFWTWDHSTNWELSQIGQQEIGVFNPYGKPPGGFLADYKRLVDFCSRNRIAAIVIYGFLRDTHGGIEAAQELCRYANERGVRIMPGIAIGAYGGVYWEGDHPYNLATWLKKNPQFAATMEKGVGFQLADLAFPLNFPRSDYTVSACPSAPETMAWMEEAVIAGSPRPSTSAASTSRAATTVSAAARAASPARTMTPKPRGAVRPWRFLVAHRHGRQLPAPLPRRQGQAAGPLDL